MADIKINNEFIPKDILDATQEVYNLKNGIKLYAVTSSDSNADKPVTMSISVDQPSVCLCQAHLSIWGYGGGQVGIEITAPKNGKFMHGGISDTKGHDLTPVPTIATGIYDLPSSGTYVFETTLTGRSGGTSKQSVMWALVIPKA